MSNSYTFHLSDVSDIGALEGPWSRLESGPNGSIFTSWQWIGTWLKTLPPDAAPRLLLARRGGADVAAAILVRRGKRLVLFNATGLSAVDSITIEHNDFATLEPNTEQLWSEFFDWFAKQRSEDLAVPGAVLALSENKVGFIVDQEKKKAYRRDDLSYSNDLLARLSRNTRQQLSKAIRALEAIGQLEIAVAPSVGEALSYFDEMKTLHILSWSQRNKRHAFHSGYFETFHRQMIADHTGTGSPQLLRISAGDRVIGYLYNFLYRDHVYAYQSGFDIKLNDLKPGYISHVLAMNYYAKRGAKIYDFLAGTNQLKQSLSNQTYPLFWIRAERSNLRNRTKSLARKMLGR